MTAVLMMAASPPAFAQSDIAADKGIDVSANRVTVGVGIASVPTYIGARTSEIVPTAAIQGQIAGLSFNSQGTGIFLDAIPDNGKPGWKLQLGPLVQLRLDRNTFVKGSAVESLGKLKEAWEVGGWAGIQKTGVVTSPYDTLSFSASYQRDISGAHGSYVISPSIDYATPLSTKDYVSLSLSADYVGKGFGSYYYDISPDQSVASGLLAYDGADKAGWKDWNASILAAHSLTGNLTHGLKIFANGGYQRILGAYARSPIVDGIGDRNQWSGAIGLGYTF
jgi:outer membrane scaffolding protein for murein synthesis (MipA/OmpV family)